MANQGEAAAPGAVLLGKFRIEKVLGQGGMGVVVAARHLQLDERVAIKFLLPEVLGRPEITERFLREARAAARIRSEHVARVSDVGTMENGAPYMVMEYLQGSDLADLLAKSGALPLIDAVEYVVQTCEALAEAHAAGVIHRDIKPANLFLTTRTDGSACVKVLDFGISKLRVGEHEALTKTQGVMGTPLYMAPEQLSAARDVDVRADIYSLGVVFYELVTGQLPYQGSDLPQLVAQILTVTPHPPSVHRPELPAELDTVVMRCLAKDRAARIADVAELANALAPYGSATTRATAERVSRIVARSPLARSSADTDSAGAAATAPTLLRAADRQVQVTSGSWGNTQLPEPTAARRHNPVVIVGVLGVLALVFGTVAILRREAPKQPTVAEPSAVPPIAKAGKQGADSTATPSDSVPPPGPPSASASQGTPAVSSTLAAKPPGAAPSASATAPGAHKTPKPAQKGPKEDDPFGKSMF